MQLKKLVGSKEGATLTDRSPISIKIGRLGLGVAQPLGLGRTDDDEERVDQRMVSLIIC